MVYKKSKNIQEFNKMFSFLLLFSYFLTLPSKLSIFSVMAKRGEQFTRNDLRDWGDPREWTPFSPAIHHHDLRQGGVDASKRPALWRLLNGFLEEKQQGRRRNTNT